MMEHRVEMATGVVAQSNTVGHRGSGISRSINGSQKLFFINGIIRGLDPLLFMLESLPHKSFSEILTAERFRFDVLLMICVENINSKTT